MDDDQNTDFDAPADEDEQASELSGPTYPAASSDLSGPEGWDNEPTGGIYEDDLDNDNDAVDPFMDEATDDPTEELGVPPEEYKNEMDKIALDDMEHDHEDTREALEDRDEADDNSASNV